jgi:hypothetical protein
LTDENLSFDLIKKKAARERQPPVHDEKLYEL